MGTGSNRIVTLTVGAVQAFVRASAGETAKARASWRSGDAPLEGGPYRVGVAL